MFGGLLRPGQGFQTFTVHKRSGKLSASGRPEKSGLIASGTIEGILSEANQREQEQWKQNGHPITHTIVQQGVKNCGKAEDVLTLGKGKATRKFHVQGTKNPGELEHFVVYYVQERNDLQ